MAFAYNGLEQIAIRGMRSAILYRVLYEDSGVECQFFFVNIDLVRAWAGARLSRMKPHGSGHRDRNGGVCSSVLVGGVEFRHSGAE